MNDQLAAEVRKAILACEYLNIASITPEGLPWNTPVWFSCDEAFNLYWGSAENSQHSINIRENPEVFITIYVAEETGIGVYIQGKAFEITNEREIIEILTNTEKVRKLSRTASADMHIPPSPLRLYKFNPRKAFVSSPKTACKYKGMWVDSRVEIQL